jgi:hypothetical protein
LTNQSKPTEQILRFYLCEIDKEAWPAFVLEVKIVVTFDEGGRGRDWSRGRFGVSNNVLFLVVVSQIT